MGYRDFPNGPADHLEWVHGLFTLLMVAAIVAGVVLIARHWRQPLPPPAAGAVPPSPALHELDLRYARGEIDRTDYLQRRADIAGVGTTGDTALPPATPPS
jgi:putative membrane protein